jgi:mono/diheme cytochrome c family protein
MFAALRRPFSRLVVLLCVAAILLPAASRSHVLWDDDPACGSTLSLPDGGARQIGAGTHSSSPTHCAVCHWLRAIAGAEPVNTASTLLGLAPQAVAISRLAWWYDAAFALDRPSRAPPVSTFLG